MRERSPHSDAASVGVIDEQVDISRHTAEHSQQQGDLPTVMNTMIGRVLH